MEQEEHAVRKETKHNSSEKETRLDAGGEKLPSCARTCGVACDDTLGVKFCNRKAINFNLRGFSGDDCFRFPGMDRT